MTEQQEHRGDRKPWPGSSESYRTSEPGRAAVTVRNKKLIQGAAEAEAAANPAGTSSGGQSTAAIADGMTAIHDFKIGDAVYISSLGRTGIVYEKKDSRGMVGIMIQKQKMTINHKRLKPYLSKEELYPEDYDFDIIFESKETRKKRKLMRKKHIEGLSIIHQEEEK